MLGHLLSRAQLATRFSALVVVSVLSVSAALLAPAAQADSASTLTVVGAPDLSESRLIDEVVKPGFEAANPGITLNYVAKSQAAAVQDGRQGSASALLLRSRGLETSFVGDGFSLERYGRAVMYGDNVIVGPASDPAGVLSAGSPSNDAVAALEKIAAAGQAGTADFVSNGGEPGDPVQGSRIWGRTTGVTVCRFSSADGGGASPSTTSGPCPDNISYPAWFHAQNVSQTQNISTANTCGYPGRSGQCYAITPRGTFAYLKSQGQAQNLRIVARDNAASARGGEDLLVNSFHAYGVNPAKFGPNAGINAAAAQKFLSWITSPGAQRAIQGYLDAGSDPPFIASAAPRLTATLPPAVVSGGLPFRVGGSLTNRTPGTLALTRVPVYLREVPAYAPARAPGNVAGTYTSSSRGGYSLTFTPLSSGTYSVATNQVAKIENPGLNPDYGDLLAPTSTALRYVRVNGRIIATSRTLSGHTLRVRGALGPYVIGSGARLYLYTAGPGRPLSVRSSRVLSPRASHFAADFALPAGTYRYQLRYANTGVIAMGTTPTYTLRVR